VDHTRRNLAFLLMATLLVVLAVYLNIRDTTLSSLEVVVNWFDPRGEGTAGSREVRITGFVVGSGQTVPNASVVVGATDSEQRHYVASSETDAKGKFEVSIKLAPTPTDCQITSIRIDAATKVGFLAYARHGSLTEDFVRQQVRRTPQELSVVLVWLIVLLFACVLVGGHVPVAPGRSARIRYYLIMAGTTAVGSLVLYMVASYMFGIETGLGPDPWRLGCVTIFKGRYVEKVEKEWLLSLTSPPPTPPTRPAPEPPKGTVKGPPNIKEGSQPPSDDLVVGLGAPLWVLFIAVIGTFLMTLSLIWDEIIEPLPTDNAELTKALNKRCHSYVQQAAFILFSPFTAIFIYQSLVATKSASSHLIVGVIALGTGPTLTALLAIGVKRAAQLLTDSGKPH
jgi:hypothetical protein